MKDVIRRTFGGLAPAYYARQFVLGLLFPAVFLFLDTQSEEHTLEPAMIVFLVVSTFLYPYSRFVYTSMVDFILGDRIIIGNVVLVLFWNLITMMVCWAFAIFIAPIGLISLFFLNRRSDEGGA